MTQNRLKGPAEQRALGWHFTHAGPPDLTETNTNHTGAQNNLFLQIVLSSRALKLPSLRHTGRLPALAAKGRALTRPKRWGLGGGLCVG